MLSEELVKRCEQLLAEDQLSQRNIARLLGISRGTVGIIAGGRRPDYEELRRRRHQEESPRKLGPPNRCPGCGALVVFSCLACELLGDGRQGTMSDGGNDGIAIDLDDDCCQRYQECWERKHGEGEPPRLEEELGKSLNMRRRHAIPRRSRHLAIY